MYGNDEVANSSLN